VICHLGLAGERDGNDVLGLVVLERGQDQGQQLVAAGVPRQGRKGARGSGGLRRRGIVSQVRLLRLDAPMSPALAFGM